MKSYICKAKIITPLFMGGANQQPELRTQSINGLLRWWFRIAGGSIDDEKRLFGWAGDKSNQGLVRIFIIKEPHFVPQNFSNSGSGYSYLGFSLRMRRREAIPIDTEFEIKISFHPKSTENDIKKFFCALWLAFNLGNFGSRSRRGFGSIMIEDIQGDFPNDFRLEFKPKDPPKGWINDQLNKIRNLKDKDGKPFWSGRKEIPYLFNNFEIYLFGQDNNWENLLNKAGEEYKNFRRKKSLDGRIVFGLPIVSVEKYKDLRRASLLMFKVIKMPNNYVLLFLISKPNNNHQFNFHPKIQNVNWNLLSDFVRDKTKIFP